LSAVLATAALLLLIALISLWVSCAMRMEGENDAEKNVVRLLRYKWSWRFALTSAAFAIIACFMPSKGTMYAIAASQVGEQVVQSETVRGIASDAQKALQQWIKKQLEPDAKK
jgi:hypothetical protein